MSAETVATLVALQAAHRALGTFEQGMAAHVIDEVEAESCQHGMRVCVCDAAAERDWADLIDDRNKEWWA